MPSKEQNLRAERIAEIKTFIIKNAPSKINEAELASVGRLSSKAMEMLLWAIETERKKPLLEQA